MALNWRNCGYFCIQEDDAENNDDVRDIILLYAEENKGNIYLLCCEGEKLVIEKYRAEKMVENDSVMFISNNSAVSEAVCSAFEASVMELLMVISAHTDDHSLIRLHWN